MCHVFEGHWLRCPIKPPQLLGLKTMPAPRSCQALPTCAAETARRNRQPFRSELDRHRHRADRRRVEPESGSSVSPGQSVHGPCDPIPSNKELVGQRRTCRSVWELQPISVFLGPLCSGSLFALAAGHRPPPPPSPGPDGIARSLEDLNQMLQFSCRASVFSAAFAVPIQCQLAVFLFNGGFML